MLTTVNYKYRQPVFQCMKHTPCEYIMWNGLPVIRKEIAHRMIINFGVNQKEAAEKLGVTPAAICQYLSHKRGNTKIEDQDIIKEITLSAQRILNDADIDVMAETCRICKIFQVKGIFPNACNACTEK
jgi:predicted transcriptional regulator